MPPRHVSHRIRPIASPHLKEGAIGRRSFSWEAHLQNDVLRPGDPPESPNRMVLQFQQGQHFYRMAFELIQNPLGPPLQPTEAWIVTMFHDGGTPGLPDCPVIPLDGTYDLPTENLR